MKYSNAMRKSSTILKQGLLVFVALVSISILIPTPYVNAQVCDEEFYSNNNIRFYNPCDEVAECAPISGSLTAPAPQSLTGESNQEKSWNYFTARGLTQVAAAGVMGNIQEESGFSASVEEASGGGGLGIIQWTGDRRTKLESAASNAGVNLADNDTALLFELNYLWDGEYGSMTWQRQVNAEATVEGDTAIASYNSKFSSQLTESQEGNGSTMVFHALIERSNDVPTAADKYDGVGVLDERIASAQGFLEEFGDGTDNNCRISSSGLNWEQAVTVAKKLVDDWDGVYCGGGSIKFGFYCTWTKGYCTAAAAWMAETTAPNPALVPGIPNGVDVADTLIMLNSNVYTSVSPDGSNLQPFSVWSFGKGSASGQQGHTGTIVGIGENGSIITLETNWSWNGDMPGATNSFNYSAKNNVAVYEYPSFEAFKNSHTGYVYNNTATPKDKSIAADMAAKMAEFMAN